MIYLLWAGLVLWVIVVALLIYLGFFIQGQIAFLAAKIDQNKPFSNFTCNVPPISDKDKAFVETAPPWVDTPAAPEEG